MHSELRNATEVSSTRLSHRLIQAFAPELGDQVLAKQITFEEARLKARDRKAEAETNAGRWRG
jgi:hypothetical protein